MGLDLPKLAVLALLLLVVAPIVLRIIFRLALRFAARGFLSAIGNQALAKQPDTLDLKRETFAVQWLDAAAMQALAGPLLRLGFADLGVYTTAKMPGMKIWFLLKEDSQVAAFLYEHPKTPRWSELSTRYEDGTTTAASNLPPTGLNMQPPFFRRIQLPPGTPSDQVYDRLIRERSQFGIKRVTAATVVQEYEIAYAKIIAWQKNRGITPEEVAEVGRRYYEKRNAAQGSGGPT